MMDEPIFDRFLENKYRSKNKTIGTIKQMEIKIKEIKQATEDCEKIQNVERLEDLDARDLHNLVEYFKSNGKSEATINQNHLNYLRTIIKYGKAINELPDSYQPVKTVRSIHEYESQCGATYPEIEHSTLSRFLRDETDRRPRRPQERAVWVLSLKTGLRAGECVNLDLQDVHINHLPLTNHEQYADIQYHPEIEDHPDSLYISSGIKQGEVYRGEKRKRGNKRQKSTIVPLDGELKHALVRWLVARPSTPHLEADPLFVSLGNSQPTRATIYQISQSTIKAPADDLGWNDHTPPEDWDIDEYHNITHKWCRHYFTTKMRDFINGMGLLYTSYFRGDKRPGATDEDLTSVSANPYTDLRWLDLRETYVNNIYKFGLPTLPI